MNLLTKKADSKKSVMLSIIIPSYNPGKRLLVLIKKLKALNLPVISKEIIVVNDGSRDPIYNDVKKEKGIIYIEHRKNKGKGGAVKTGFLKAKGDILLIQDDDLEYDTENITGLIKPLLLGKSDVVYGSRRLNKNNKYSSKMYLWGGSFVNLLISLFLRQNITDSITGAKAFTRKVYEKIKPIESHGFEIESEITAKIVKNGFKILEVPITYYPRSRKEGKNIRWHHGFKLVWALLKYSR